MKMGYIHLSFRILIISALLFVSSKTFSSDNETASYNVNLKLIREVGLPLPPVDIILKDGFAYVLCSGTGAGILITFNISDPANIPSDNVSKINIEGGTPTALSFNGSYAYVSSLEGKIAVVDFRNNTKPKEAGSIDANGQIVKMAINNGFLYLIRKDFGLNVYDVSVPDFPLYKGTQLVPGEANGIFVKNNLAYISSSNAYLSIIDVSDISKLPIVGSYNFGMSFYDIYVSDNMAYLAQGSTGVQVINVTQTANPKWITNIFSRNFSKQVVVSGYYTWVNDQNTIQAFYNKDPKQQMYAGSFDNNRKTINKIEVQDGKYIYLCSSDSKLKAIQINYNY